MKLRHSLLVLFCLLACLKATLQQDQSPNCVFVGCSCGDDADHEIVDSKEAEETGNGVSASSISYDITCKDENDPSAKIFEFPERDTSKKFSPNIAFLDLSGNELTTIPDDRFDKLEVAMADLSKNKISSISDNAFRGITKLEVLDLSQNQLEDLNEAAFEPIKSTLILKLNHNKLSAMDNAKLGNLLTKLNSLKTLALRHNQLVNLPNLSKMNKLEELLLANNQIEALTDGNEQLLPNSLIDLGLESNRIKEINENSLANLKNLKYLNLESNQISFIHDNAFAHLTRLATVNLAKNYLKQIPSRLIFTLVNLERLDLSAQNQMIKEIEDFAFDRQSNAQPIKKIDLSKNRIARIDNKAFCSRNRSHPYVNIKELDLASNSLTSINSCVLRQMSKGYSEHQSLILAKINNEETKLKSKVSFKPTIAAEKTGSGLKCDCEITKAASLVDLEGECENDVGTAVQLKQYNCGSESGISEDEVAKSCSSMAEFDCLEQSDSGESPNKGKIDDKQDYRQGGSTSGGGGATHPYEYNKPSDKKNNVATKQPVVESRAASFYFNSSIYNVLLLALVVNLLVKYKLF